MDEEAAGAATASTGRVLVERGNAMQGGKRGAADENTKWVSIKKG